MLPACGHSCHLGGGSCASCGGEVATTHRTPFVPDPGSAPAPEKGKSEVARWTCLTFRCRGREFSFEFDGLCPYCDKPLKPWLLSDGTAARHPITAAYPALGGAPEKEPEPRDVGGPNDRCPHCANYGCVCSHAWGESCRCGAQFRPAPGQSAGEPERAAALALALFPHDHLLAHAAVMQASDGPVKCCACWPDTPCICGRDYRISAALPLISEALRGAAPSAPEGQECEVCEAQGRKPAADNFGWFICQEHHMDALKRERVEGFDEGRESSAPEGQEIQRLREALRGIAEADPDAPEVESWKWLARKFMADARAALEGR